MSTPRATHRWRMALTFSLAMLVEGPVLAADVAALRKDLTSVIMLLGLPCGPVLNVEEHADKDHTVTCTTGDRYRVFVNTAGRVVAEKK